MRNLHDFDDTALDACPAMFPLDASRPVDDIREKCNGNANSETDRMPKRRRHLKILAAATTKTGRACRRYSKRYVARSRRQIEDGPALPQAVAKGVTGHKTDSMFSRYNITSGEDMREALRKQRAHLSGRAGSNLAEFPSVKGKSE
jgi:hypothetical protein